MNSLIVQIANILAPGLFLALIGLVWQQRGPHFPVDFVTTLILNVCMPALLFQTLATSTVPITALGQMALATLVVHLVFALVSIVLLHLAKKDWRLCIAQVVGNTGNLGLPVCFLAFGEEGLAYAMSFFAVQCILLFTLGDAVYAGSASIARVLRSPVIHAIWLGVAVRLLDWAVPSVAMQTLELLGQIVIPLMLITLGISLADMRANQLSSTLWWSLVRTALACVVALGVAGLLGLQGVARGVLIIQTMVPVAVFNYLLSLRHGHDASEISGLILVTHLGAVFYLPVVLGFLLGS